jgi:hypothetical protein
VILVRLTPRGTSASAAFARSHGTRFVYNQGAAHKILAMTRIYGAYGGRIVVNFNKPKTPSLSGKTISHDSHRIDRHAIIGKEVP